MRYDVVIIGSGAGGGPLALRVASAGYNVLVLEKGPRFDPDDYIHDPLVIEHGLFTPTLEEDPHTVVTRKNRKPIKTTLGWTASCVGGGTAHMGAYFYRLHPTDFRMKSTFGAFHGLEDWPFDYDDLEPFYCEAEREMGVSGLSGSDPFEGNRSKPYPMAPLKAHPIADRIDAVSAARGLTSFPTPRAINTAPYMGRPACSYCEACAGYGCPTGARGTSQSALLPRAEATGNCRVEANAMVSRILLNENGAAQGCVYRDEEGRETEVAADIVCVCCSAIESARLLLLSKTPLHPQGIGNNAGQVGRNLQFHGVTMGHGFLPEDAHAPTGKSDGFIGRSIMDHYFLPDHVSELPKGGVIRFDFDQQVPTGNALAQKGAPRICFEVFHDYIPTPENFVELDDEVSDRWGLPAARIHLAPHPHHRIAGQWLAERAAEILKDAGASHIEFTDVGATSSYLVLGTCRAGADPATSVLDANCKVHGVANLYVVDGGFFPTSGGGPPTLTIIANSFRVARHILKTLDGLR